MIAMRSLVYFEALIFIRRTKLLVGFLMEKAEHYFQSIVS